MTGEPNEGPSHVGVTDQLVRDLVVAQFPEFAKRDIGRRYVLDDHIMVRLGDDLCVRLPTIAGLDDSLRTSARWLPLIASDWSFPAGFPIGMGRPECEYPYSWEITAWLPGSNAAILELNRDAASSLGHALRQVHGAAPPSAPIGADAGVTLGRHRKAWNELAARVATETGPRGERIDLRPMADSWEVAVDTVIDVTLRWTHGNLDPRFVVSNRGHFGGIGTWFTFGSGDPAADIGAALLLMPVEAEPAFYSGYGTASQATQARASGYRILRALRYATSPNPFLWRMGWERLAELAITPS